MSWFSSRYDDSNDASKANTISDTDYRGLQTRAGRANPKLANTFSDEAAKARLEGGKNYSNRWWN